MTYQFGDLVLDKYKVEIILGQGAYGDLYRVSHLGFVGQRAIKVFNRNDFFKRSISYENVQRRFNLESLLAKKLNSPKPNPYLLQIYDFLESKEELILEMDYAPAGNLNYRMSEYKSKGIPFQRDRAIRIAYEIAVGMSALHSHDIVHRNIKPANVLFNLRDHALLADLGFAQLPEEPGSRIRPGFTSSYPLSPGYSSPEQLLSSDILTPSSDVYTLGLILFEMLTGKVFSSIGPRTRLSDLIPGVRPSLDELLTNMLSDSPGNRPKDGKSVALELSKELEEEDQAQQEELAKKRREI